MGKWVDVGSESELNDGGKRCVQAGSSSLVLCKVDGQTHAFDNVCPHASMPLGEGNMEGKIITCPFHGYTYDVQTGKNIDFAEDIPLSMRAVRVTESGRLEVEVLSDDS